MDVIMLPINCDYQCGSCFKTFKIDIDVNPSRTITKCPHCDNVTTFFKVSPIQESFFEKNIPEINNNTSSSSSIKVKEETLSRKSNINNILKTNIYIITRQEIYRSNSKKTWKDKSPQINSYNKLKTIIYKIIKKCATYFDNKKTKT